MLYGFTTQASLELFLLLNGVSGVGPRLALALLSKLGASTLNQAIVSGDIASLASATGVGRRTASRIVLDLKGKVESFDSEGFPGQASDDAEGHCCPHRPWLFQQRSPPRRGQHGP